MSLFRISLIIFPLLIFVFAQANAEESVTVSGEAANKASKSVDFTDVAYDNPEKSTHEEFHIAPAYGFR